MPLPTPRKGEKQDDFIGRCVRFAVGEGMPQKQALAACFSTWRRSKQKMDLELMYQIPIEERGIIDGDFLIAGTALNSTLTSNNHKFIPEELQKSAKTLMNVPLLVDHRNEVDAIKGRVIFSEFDEIGKKINFKAKVIDDKIKEMIKDGRLNSVSVGAQVEDIEEGEDGTLIPRNIQFKELSLVAIPADEGATFSIALQEAYNTKLKEKIGNKMQEQETYNCECIECGYRLKSTKHCRDIKCPKCGGQMRRAERPGPGQAAEKQVTDMEALRKRKGMSPAEFYAAPRDPPSSSALPIFDAAHTRNAMARFNQTKFKSPEEKRRARQAILRAAKKFGINADNFKKTTQSFSKESERRLKMSEEETTENVEDSETEEVEEADESEEEKEEETEDEEEKEEDNKDEELLEETLKKVKKLEKKIKLLEAEKDEEEVEEADESEEE